jgi:excisionase family DNA binding protein
MSTETLFTPVREDLPLTVRDAASFLGVSPQTYLWVERKQIPHLRVMGRNIRFRRNDSKVWWMRYRDRSGGRRLESTHTEDW